MKHVKTDGIILSRTDFGEADRILTVLTPDHGKQSLLAKGVRKSASKLAGGVELFSVSQLSYIEGRGELRTLTSTKLARHYGRIVQDIQRTMLGYEFLRRLHKNTETEPGSEYYYLLVAALGGLDDSKLSPEVLEAWFDAQLIKLAGHQPNLRSDNTGSQLQAELRYVFDAQKMALQPSEQGRYHTKHIKLLRLLFGLSEPDVLSQVQGLTAVLPPCRQLISSLAAEYLRR